MARSSRSLDDIERRTLRAASQLSRIVARLQEQERASIADAVGHPPGKPLVTPQLVIGPTCQCNGRPAAAADCQGARRTRPLASWKRVAHGQSRRRRARAARRISGARSRHRLFRSHLRWRAARPPSVPSARSPRRRRPIADFRRAAQRQMAQQQHQEVAAHPVCVPPGTWASRLVAARIPLSVLRSPSRRLTGGCNGRSAARPIAELQGR
jgi:hypothetical protein